MSLNNVPPFVQRQYWLEHQRQTPGRGGAGTLLPFKAGSSVEPAAPVSEHLPVQQTTSQCRMVTTNFIGRFSGAYNPRRAYLLIQNTGATPMHVIMAGTQGLGGTDGLVLQAVVGFWEPAVVPVDNYTIIGSGVVLEGQWI